MSININKDSQVVIRGRVCNRNDHFWVTVRLKESGIITEFPLKDVYHCQRQDSLLDQLNDVIYLANRLGCYDAADFIKDKLEESAMTKRLYNRDYGDDKICICGHPYYRHFDTYENMRPVGCKYCDCQEFRLSHILQEKKNV